MDKLADIQWQAAESAKSVANTLRRLTDMSRHEVLEGDVQVVESQLSKVVGARDVAVAE